MNSSIDVLTSDQRTEWLQAVRGAVAHDFYHLPFYHDLAKDLGEGEPRLFIYSCGEYRIMLPLLLRQIKDVPAPIAGGQPWHDATSVYGYPGPIASHATIPAGIVRDFQEVLEKTLLEMRVVSVFSRLHPFFDQASLLTGLGTVVFHGHTVSIDLSIPEEAQLAQYRENHRRGIRKLRAAGATCSVDEELRHLDTFVDQYNETMDRAGARDSYRFPQRYFRQLVSTTEAEVKLVLCSLDGQIISSGLFVKCNGFVEYHLGATAYAYQKMGPMKLVLDAVRHWGWQNGTGVFHLGGGVGCRDDSLASFKSGFSDRLHPFNTWRWILRQDVYDALVEARKQRLPGQDNPTELLYFPAYRTPDSAERTMNGSQSDELRPEVEIPPSDSRNLSRKSVIGYAKPNQTGETMEKTAPKKRLIILGAGGHARVIADAILCRQSQPCAFELLGFLDDNPSLFNKKVLERPVLGSFADLARIPHEAVVVGIGDNEKRSGVFMDLTNRGETLATVIHPRAIIAHDVVIGKGTVVFAGAVVNTGSIIGEGVILNTGCSVDHDCVIGPHAHICPGSRLGGGVTVGQGAFIGINSAIIHNTKVGEWSTVGAGAAVIRDVAPNVTVVGVPARVLPPRLMPRKPDTRDLFFLENID